MLFPDKPTGKSTGDTPFNLRDEIKLRLSGQILLLGKAFSKIVYKELRKRIVTPPIAKLKFNAHFVNDTLNWKKIQRLVLQYIVLIRFLVTNTFLCKIGIIILQHTSYVVNRMNPSHIFSCLVIILRIFGLRL